jgi:O-antigen ligase
MTTISTTAPASMLGVVRARPVAFVALGALGYTILLGGTGRGELEGVLQVLNGLLAAFFILLHVRRAPSQADRVDRGVLLGLLLFLAAAVLSAFPRQSFDAALGALTATAALFVLRGELDHAEVRTAFVRLFVVLSGLLTFLTAALWLPTTLEWWSLTGWSVVPPLDLNFSAAPWGHRHDLALLVVLLYPSHLIGPLSPLRRVLAVVFGVLVVLIVLVDGSRNLWLAMLLATAAVMAPIAYRRLRANPRARRVAVVGLLVIVALVLVSGLAAVLADRLLNLQSLGWRSEMWGSLVEAWTGRPIAGYGPGSFAWILQTTDYYDTNSWAPRHPDSAFFQLLAEGGILGLAGTAVVLGTLLPPVIRSASQSARWALATFVLASIGANPTDFPFLVATAVAWTAFAMPRPEAADEPRLPRSGLIRGVTLASLVIVGLAFAATTTAGLYYGAASDAAEREDFDRARGALDTAIALDPGMALYLRQRGTLDYLAGADTSGLTDLYRATTMNPSDDLAWRTLALAYASTGYADAASAALERALDAQRSDAANLLVAARELGRAGDEAGTLETLGEIVHSWPHITEAPEWAELLPMGASTVEVVGEALRRWQSNLPTPEPFADQGIVLAAFSGGDDLDEAAIEVSGVGEPLSRAALSVMRCDPDAGEALAALDDSDRRLQMYWELVIRDSSGDGATDESAVRLLEIMRGSPILPETADDVLNPMVETGFSNDRWGYRRRPIVWPANPDVLPSPDAGEVRSLFYPSEAAEAADLTERLPECR